MSFHQVVMLSVFIAITLSGVWTYRRHGESATKDHYKMVMNASVCGVFLLFLLYLKLFG